VPRSVLVTGASSGIGAATAAHLHALGFRVYGSSRKPEGRAASRQASEADRPAPPSQPAIARWIAMDVRDEASVQRGVESVLADGPLYGVVCNAGVGVFGSVEELSIEAARAQLETNYFGVLRTLRAVLPGMREARSGRVVLVGSLAGRAPIPFQSHYSSSKAAVDALALALRNELHGLGIGVSLVEPGDIDTGFNEAMEWGTGGGSAYGERIRRCEAVIRASLPKAPGPECVARAIGRALTARRPRVRYPVGPDSRLVPLGRRLLPDALSLLLVRRHFGV
jgi:NAD(P)-dependent dehydrogenase (short-subunit alcohol dehydrogenase family)